MPIAKVEGPDGTIHKLEVPEGATPQEIEAFAAENKVDLTKKSEFTFDAVSKNPIFETHYSNVNVCEPVGATDV